MKNKTLNTQKCRIDAIVQRNSFNKEDRTVEVVFSTGSKGKRYTWSGSYYEELSLKKDHVRLDRLNAGAPVLNNHSSWDLKYSLGVVEKAWLKGKEARAILRLSSREDVAGIVQDIEEGIIRNISVGYVVHKVEDISKKGDTIPTYRAVDWEPMEISFVNMPFDKDAQVRSLEKNKEQAFETEIITREAEMDDETTTETEVTEIETETKTATDPTRSADLNKSVEQNLEVKETNERSLETEKQTTPAPVVENKEVTVDKVELEKNRGIEIRSAVKSAGLDESFSEKLIKDDVTVDKAREMIIGEISERNSTKTNNHIVEVKDVDQRKLRIEMASNALLHRAKGDQVELHKDATQYRGMSLLRMAEETLTSQGVSARGLTPHEIAERALHSSSDFVEILANVAGKSLRQAYDEAPQTFGPFTRRTQVADFKQISRVQLGDAPALEKVLENGEYKSGTVGEAAEKYNVDTFGKIIGVTRKTLVNDDMDAFSRLPEMFGRSARDLESDLIYNIIKANPLMADGYALFSAQHGNLGTADAITVASISEARAKMRLQKGLNQKLLNLVPKILLVPATIETVAEQFLGNITPAEGAKVNPFSGKFQQITEARLDAHSLTAWYLLASINQIDIFEIANLTGQTGPTLTTKEGFKTDGVEFKVSYDVGAKAIDWRGIVKNVGA